MKIEEKYNILIVDDKPHNLLAMEALLEQEDRNIVTASSGNEALGLMLVHDFALILLDIQMPGMDGLETARIIKKSNKTKHIPIIFITAINKEKHHVFEGYNAGAIDYIFKPVEPMVLKAKINVLLQLHGQKKNIDRTNQLLTKMIQDLELANRKLLYHHKTAVDSEHLKAALKRSTATALDLKPAVRELIEQCKCLTDPSASPDQNPMILKDMRHSAERISRTAETLQTIHDTLPDTKDRPCPAILAVGRKTGEFESLTTPLKNCDTMSLYEAGSVREALSLLSKQKINAVLMIDYILPDGTGFDILDRMKQEALDIPVIFATDSGDEMIAVFALKEGAYDYISRSGLNEKKIMESLSHALEKERLKEDINALYDHLAVLSNKDALTKLYNRRYFNDTIEAQISRIKRYGSHMSVCMIDLDHFENINMQFGHLAGDKVLLKTADVLKDLVRQCDVVCRFDDRAFGLILPETAPHDAMIVGERIRKRISNFEYGHHDQAIGVTVSIGIASCDKNREPTLPGLISEAGMALSSAKAGGRNRVELYNR